VPHPKLCRGVTLGRSPPGRYTCVMARNQNHRGLGTVSAKVPLSTIAELDQLAQRHCTSRSFLLRELIEAALEGRVELEDPAERMQRRVRASLAPNSDALRSALAQGVGAVAAKPSQAVAPAEPDVGGTAHDDAAAA
jgi:predicted DNA-binding protein